MKGLLFATLLAAAVGLAMPAGSAVAAPVNAMAIGEAAAAGNPVIQVHARWRSRGWRHARGRSHVRWRSRGWRHWRGRSVTRCHTRSWSRWRPC